jgi:hypothetical protein
LYETRYKGRSHGLEEAEVVTAVAFLFILKKANL